MTRHQSDKIFFIVQCTIVSITQRKPFTAYVRSTHQDDPLAFYFHTSRPRATKYSSIEEAREIKRRALCGEAGNRQKALNVSIIKCMESVVE